MTVPAAYVDLTHTLRLDVPGWDANCDFCYKNTCDYTDFAGPTKFRAQSIAMSASIGTHMDAPAHCIQGGRTIADIPISELVRPCIVIDVSKNADERFVLGTEPIVEFEAQYGVIAPDTVVLISSGWSSFWPDSTLSKMWHT
ncbi:MAG: hypothetical protein B7X06_01590 [Verrucomicrobia bacterium 21-51-4]|nr:MAG: hypothetical protein B7X06_01590 [Verrucomicrobia bacterium 21-51-4]